VANPRSGSCDAVAVAEQLRSLGTRVETFEVGEPERAAAAGCDRLAVAGGDGSIAPAAAAAGAAGIPLAVIPAGTANDFARRMGLPVDPAAARRAPLAYRLRSGGLARHRRARRGRCASALVRVPDGTEWNVDGEIVSAGTSRFRGEAHAFRLVSPR
jgi:Diacylglycerol kinase catalytic domain